MAVSGQAVHELADVGSDSSEKEHREEGVAVAVAGEVGAGGSTP
eukprot:SAG11_NODE_12475_length_701_cov_1.252492_1_plen_44_part_00